VITLPAWTGYKVRPWNPHSRDNYAASLTSEGVTIAVEPLFTDALAALAFDKKDIVTRGIMPLAIIIFNDNDYPVEVDGVSVELIHEDTHLRTLYPGQALDRIYNDGRGVGSRNPGSQKGMFNADAVADFENKFLMNKIIAPHDKGWGFLYLHVSSSNLVQYLSKSRVYIPNIYRRDKRSRLIFFEIDLDAAMMQKGSPEN
jgi:hypothetical protein